tara:strand:+ start:3501 stop:4127 length:627 start_codon:yes stop_codon:yes gene_type:complete
MTDLEKRFLELAIELEALLFGEFILKSGRESVYFFNIATFLESGRLGELAEMYLEKISECDIDYDVIFGPSYKGIPLAAALATLLNQKSSMEIPICFDRKEEKSHGEGGALVGSVKNKKVLIIDDVLTAGTALKNSIKLIQEAGGTISSAVIALDRQEQDDGEQVSKKLENELNIPIFSISSLGSLISFLESTDQENVAKKLKSSIKN